MSHALPHVHLCYALAASFNFFDHGAGAMENWGLITYRETALLLSEDSSLRSLRSVVATIAHEMSHLVRPRGRLPCLAPCCLNRCAQFWRSAAWNCTVHPWRILPRCCICSCLHPGSACLVSCIIRRGGLKRTRYGL